MHLKVLRDEQICYVTFCFQIVQQQYKQNRDKAILAKLFNLNHGIY